MWYWNAMLIIMPSLSSPSKVVLEGEVKTLLKTLRYIGFGHAYLTKFDQSIISIDPGCTTFRHNFDHRVTKVNHEL